MPYEPATFWIWPDAAAELREIRKDKGLSASELMRQVMDAYIDFAEARGPAADALKPGKGQLEISRLYDRARSRRFLPKEVDLVPVTLSLRTDQMSLLREFSKEAEEPGATAFRAAWLMWKAGYLDPALPNVFKSRQLEKGVKPSGLVRIAKSASELQPRPSSHS